MDTHYGETCEYDFLNVAIINQVWARDFGLKNIVHYEIVIRSAGPK
jgi:hypothetical protein